MYTVISKKFVTPIFIILNSEWAKDYDYDVLE